MRYVPVEQARKRLGRLLQEVSAGHPVVIGRRGTDQAVLISGAEYERLRRIEEENARALFRQALESISAAVREEGIGPEVVDEAIRAARRR